MRNCRCPILVIGIVLFLFALPAFPADQVWQRPGLYTAVVQDVYIRTHPMGLVRGTLYQGQSFYAFTHRKGWMWGFAFGNCNKPGWAPVGSDGTADFVFAPKSSQRKAPTTMSGQPRYLNKGITYVTAKERKEKGTPYSNFLEVTADTLTIYGNYSSKTGPADPIITLRKGTDIGIRYVFSKPWVIVQLKSVDSPDGKPHWGFADSTAIGKPGPGGKPAASGTNAKNAKIVSAGPNEADEGDFEDEPDDADTLELMGGTDPSATPEDESIDERGSTKAGSDGTIQGGDGLPDDAVPTDFGEPGGL